MAQRFRAMQPAPTLSPRYYQAASPMRPLGKRQDASCRAGEHPCLDIGSVGASSCCADDTYCIVNPINGTASCCAFGSVCGSSCSESEYQCVGTTTITSPLPASTSTYPACCPRQCTGTSQFGCPSALGGGCCSFGQTCASNKQCIRTSTATSSSSLTSLISAIPPGCTTSQILCPGSLGGGCCAVTQSCTFVGGSGPQCAEITTVPTGSGVSAVPQDGSGDGLGTGAKAGIGVGSVVVVGLAIGLATWFCLRRRRRALIRRYTAREGLQSGSASDARTPTSGTVGGSRRQQRPPRRIGMGLLAGGPRGAPEMVESHSDVVSRGGRLRGLTADYFGPNAVAGPFTEATTPAAAGNGEQLEHNGTSAATTPPTNSRDRAVPMDPQSPDDIIAPVEIDSRMRERERSETIDGRFELYGSELQGHSDVSSPFTPSPGTMSNSELKALGYLPEDVRETDKGP